MRTRRPRTDADRHLDAAVNELRATARRLDTRRTTDGHPAGDDLRERAAAAIRGTVAATPMGVSAPNHGTPIRGLRV